MKQFVRDILESAQYDSVRLLQILIEVQDAYQHLPVEAIDFVAESLNIPRTQIISVAEFYSFLHLEPQGQYTILFSDSITDLMADKADLMAYMSSVLNVDIDSVRQDGRVSLGNTSCTGLCDQGPAVLINGYAVPRLDRTRVDEISEFVEQQLPLSKWPHQYFQIDNNIRKTGLLLKQQYRQGEALTAMWQKGLRETLKEIDQAGLRGRGGAGFNTARKWQFCAEAPSVQRYVVCNADEGEPGTFKDRVLLTAYADQIFEGMTVCGAIIGSSQGFLYLRGEYRYLLDHLHRCLQQRQERGLLGQNILDRGFDFSIEIRLGAGAYICGEESALIESLEGRRGIPRNRPPYPVSKGYLQQPTVVNNVETFLAAAAIVEKGSGWFRQQGTELSAGSKIISISGDCADPGVYEYPFGISVRQVLQDCGIDDVLGVQVGGPSGVFISEEEFDRKLAYEDLATGGSFIVFNKTRKILEIVQNFTHFFAAESCGFCTPCRVGTSLLKKQLDKIIDGYGSAGDVVALEEISRLLKNYSHCGLGQTAANPLLSTLQRFPGIYQDCLKAISYEPGFDLDASLQTARRMTGRDDEAAHLSQLEE